MISTMSATGIMSSDEAIAIATGFAEMYDVIYAVLFVEGAFDVEPATLTDVVGRHGVIMLVAPDGTFRESLD